MLIEVLLLLLLLCLLSYWYVTRHYGYFASLGIPEDPGSFPYGSECMKRVWTGKVTVTKSFEDPERKFANERFWGLYMFGQRQLVVKDVDLGKLMVVKDAEYFNDRMTFGLPYKERKEDVDRVIGLLLLNINGDLWRRMRSLASPIFTSSKLRLMVPHINEVRVDTEKTAHVIISVCY